MVELIGRARERLGTALAATFAEERERFDRLVPAPDELEKLEADLRAAADELRMLPPALPDAAGPVVPAGARFGRPDPTGAG
jgi:hypothetical protein